MMVMFNSPDIFGPRAKLIVIKDCTCKHSEHETTEYPRPGIKLMHLKEGDKVTVVNEWSNLLGSYIKVTKDDENKEDEGYQYDITRYDNNFKHIHEEITDNG